MLWVDCVHTQKVTLQSFPPVPLNVTLFRNRVIADVISSFKRMPCYSEVRPSSNMPDVLSRIWPSEDTGKTHIKMKEEHHRKMEAEPGLTLSQGACGAPEVGRREK